MAVSPRAPLKDRVVDHCAISQNLLTRPNLRNRDIQAKLRTSKRLHGEVLKAFYDTRNEVTQDLGYYHRMLIRLDELMLDLLSRATTFPTE